MERDAWPYTVNTYSYTFTHSAGACIEQQAARGFAHFEVMMYPAGFAVSGQLVRRANRGSTGDAGPVGWCGD